MIKQMMKEAKRENGLSYLIWDNIAFLAESNWKTRKIIRESGGHSTMGLYYKGFYNARQMEKITLRDIVQEYA